MNIMAGQEIPLIEPTYKKNLFNNLTVWNYVRYVSYNSV